MSMFMAMTTPRKGVIDSVTKQAATTTPTRATNRSTSAGSRRRSRLAMGIPARRPRIWAGSATAEAKPRWAEFSPNSCS